MYQSEITGSRAGILFPEIEGRVRIYMHEISAKQLSRAHPYLLSPILRPWVHTIRSMLKGIKTKLPMFVTVDQAHVNKGSCHRRPGLHVDGNWIPVYEDVPYSSSHGATQGSYKNLVAHKTDFPLEYGPETILLASNVTDTCRAFVGSFEGEISCEGDGGDCSLVTFGKCTEVLFQVNTVYRCGPTTLHETLPMPLDGKRIFVRICIPGLPQ